ncbi:MAG: GxxExxY protein [Saprospiraceae bacterium]|nr:GxxExxY protein [Saprospiraceae bacterium]
MIKENELGKTALDCAFKVHRALGPGLLESTYEACLEYELLKLGLHVTRQHPLPVIYDDVKLENGYRIDLFIEKCVIIEVKSIELINPIHVAQILTYLKLSGVRLGYLINFNSVLLKHGIRRLIN